uniref:Xylulose kinase-1 n=1 Tax=Tanacetum cinerariifolium TaxID=118510 RepID=A0A699HZY4_TANCI|nr:xylulose kinase-1 [Tanacetum cinerariifolium]
MSLTFADTHNMVAYLNKSDAREGFNQVIDFLNANYIKYALTINPHIYVSCIKQFWNTVVVKQTNDVTRLQALVDKKKVVITEATIRDALRLGDAKGVDCLPNEEIFAEWLWKFLIHTILQSLSAKCTSWNKFSSTMASAVICLSTGNLSAHTTTYTSPALTQKVFSNMRRVGKGFSGVDIPLFKGMLVAGVLEEEDDVHEPLISSPNPPTLPPQQSQDLPSTSQVQHTPPQSPLPPSQPLPQAQPQAADLPMSLLQEALDAYATLTRRVEHLEYDKLAQALQITKLKRRVKKLERGNKVKVLKLRRLKKIGTSQRIDSSDDTVMEDASNQGRMIDDLDKDDVVDLMNDKGEEKKEEEEDEPKVQEVVDVVTTAKLIIEVVTAAIRVAAASTRRRKGVVIKDPEEESTTIIPADIKSKDKEYARKLYEELNKDIDWNVAIDHVKQKAKEDPFVQRYQVMKKRPQTEAQAQRNMIMYLKNDAGFRLDYFKGMSYDDIPKRRKLNEEVKDLKQHLEIVPDEDDDVYTEASPLAREVPVVDYEIIHLNTKPHYKIIRVDGTHQLYVSFLTLLKNFDPEDLESLWSFVKERFSTSKPNNFSDDFLLTTLGAMFERPDGQAQV